MAGPPNNARATALAVVAMAVGGLAALGGLGALAASSHPASAAEEVWRGALGSWLTIGHGVDIVRGGLLVATGVGILTRARWKTSSAFAAAAIAVVRALVGFYLIEDSLNPVLTRLSLGSRDEQILSAYLDGGLMLQMIMGLFSAIFAVFVAWVLPRWNVASPPAEI